MDAIPIDEFVAQLLEPAATDALLDGDRPLLLVDLDSNKPTDSERCARAASVLAALPIVVMGTSVHSTPIDARSDLIDVFVAAHDEEARARVIDGVAANPLAATALATLMRRAETRSINDGLVAESAVYSALQGGREFIAWRATRSARDRPSDEETVILRRDDNILHVTLNRPRVHNALNTQMRDQLYEAFLLAACVPHLRVVLDGRGPSFSAGGDLDEFGARSDPASAHKLRLQRSIGRLIASISDRVDAFVHGSCLGAGVELPAFAKRVTAHPDARFGLPEVGLGLIPGAGGTVSITRRIGRQRTTYLALSGIQIDAVTAVTWGLIDDIDTANS